MKYGLVIFDFDGTLADTLPWLVQAMGRLSGEFGFRVVGEAELEALRSRGPREILASLQVPVWKAPLIARRVRSLMAQEHQSLNLFGGVERLFPLLRARGAVISIVSSNSEENVRRVLGPDLAGLVCHFECGTSLLGKSRRLRKVLHRSGQQASQALYVGDEIRDLEAARHAGIASAAVGWGYNTLEALKAHGPTETFATRDELLAFFAA